jgi:hypothetical protein
MKGQTSANLSEVPVDSNEGNAEKNAILSNSQTRVQVSTTISTDTPATDLGVYRKSFPTRRFSSLL